MTYLAELVGDRPAELRLEPVEPGEDRPDGPSPHAVGAAGRRQRDARVGGPMPACARPPAHGTGRAGEVVEPLAAAAPPDRLGRGMVQERAAVHGTRGCDPRDGRRGRPGPGAPAARSRSRDADGAPGQGPGGGLFDARLRQLLEMVARLVALQAGFADRTEELLAAGLPDWRATAFARAATALAGRDEWFRARRGNAGCARRPGRRFFPGVSRILRSAACPRRSCMATSTPATGVPARTVRCSWTGGQRSRPSDVRHAGVPHQDPSRDVDGVRNAWLDAWSAERPDAGNRRAAELIAPVAALRQALIVPDLPRQHRGNRAHLPPRRPRTLAARGRHRGALNLSSSAGRAPGSPCSRTSPPPTPPSPRIPPTP